MTGERVYLKASNVFIPTFKNKKILMYIICWTLCWALSKTASVPIHITFTVWQNRKTILKAGTKLRREMNGRVTEAQSRSP